MRWGEHRLWGTRPLGTHLQNRDGLTCHVGQDATGAPRAWVDEAVAKPLEKVRGCSLSPVRVLSGHWPATWPFTLTGNSTQGPGWQLELVCGTQQGPPSDSPSGLEAAPSRLAPPLLSGLPSPNRNSGISRTSCTRALRCRLCWGAPPAKRPQ